MCYVCGPLSPDKESFVVRYALDVVLLCAAACLAYSTDVWVPLDVAIQRVVAADGH